MIRDNGAIFVYTAVFRKAKTTADFLLIIQVSKDDVTVYSLVCATH
jgi:hypothetical protein